MTQQQLFNNLFIFIIFFILIILSIVNIIFFLLFNKQKKKILSILFNVKNPLIIINKTGKILYNNESTLKVLAENQSKK